MSDDGVWARMHAFLERHDLMVVATFDTGRGVPECAMVSFAVTAELELVFGTPVTARKYRNLQTNPHVAALIGSSSATGSMQYEGVAEEVSAGRIGGALRKIEVPDPDQRYFLVRPSWVRFFDVDRTDEVVFSQPEGPYPLSSGETSS